MKNDFDSLHTAQNDPSRKGTAATTNFSTRPAPFDAAGNTALKTTQPLFKVKRARIGGLDVLRGLCVLLMIIDHAAFDIMWLPEFCNNYYTVPPNGLSRLSDWIGASFWETDWRMAIRLPVIAVFFVISGICTSFSKSNGMRGVKLALASCGLSFATIAADDLFDMGLTILFGVLHCFTAAVFIYVLLDMLIKDKAKYACLGLGFLFLIWGTVIDFYNIPYDLSLRVSEDNLSLTDMLRVILGFSFHNGGDCFGIIPYAGFFLVGVYGGKALYGRRTTAYLPLFDTKPFVPVRWVGKHALWAYLLHQPIVLGVVALIAHAYGYAFF